MSRFEENISYTDDAIYTEYRLRETLDFDACKEWRTSTNFPFESLFTHIPVLLYASSYLSIEMHQY